MKDIRSLFQEIKQIDIGIFSPRKAIAYLGYKHMYSNSFFIL